MRISSRLLVLSVLVGCGAYAHGEASAQSGPEAVIRVPSDPRATYYVLGLEKRADGLVEITSRRQGPSGTSYAKRLVNCGNGTAKYLGEGDTLQEMERAKPEDQFWNLCCGSISAYVSVYACEQTGSLVPRHALR